MKMETHAFLLVLFFLIAVTFAIMAVYQHRQKNQKKHNSPYNESRSEPKFYNNTSIESRDANLSMSDPVVDSNFNYSKVDNGITIKRNEIHLKNVINGKTKVETEKNVDLDEPSADDEERAKQFFPNDYISIILMSDPEKHYSGYELLQGLLSAGMRFGKRNIFHRYQTNGGKNNILFSLASVVKPGTFEMTKMGGFSTPGLILFMRVSTQTDAMMAFELLLETARQLRDDLEGEIKLDPNTLLQEETINEIRQRIGEYEQSKHTTDLFAEESE